MIYRKGAPSPHGWVPACEVPRNDLYALCEGAHSSAERLECRSRKIGPAKYLIVRAALTPC